MKLELWRFFTTKFHVQEQEYCQKRVGASTQKVVTSMKESLDFKGVSVSQASCNGDRMHKGESTCFLL